MGFMRNAAGVAATSAGQMVISLGSSILLARWLTVDGRGIYAAAITIATLLALVARAGLPSAAIYQLQRVHSRSSDVASTILLCTVAFSALVLAGAGALEQEISQRFLSEAHPAVFSLTLMLIPLQLLMDTLAGLCRALDRFALANAYLIARALIGFVGLVVALVFLSGGVVEALAAFAASGLVVLPFLVRVARLTGLSRSVGLGSLRETLRYGGKSHAQLFAGQMHERLGIFMLAMLLEDPGPVAFYAIAANLVQRVLDLPGVVGTALLPKLAGLGSAESAQFAAQVLRHTTMWLALSILALGAISPVLVPGLYGQSYRASVTPFLILLPGAGFHAIYRILARHFMARDRHQVNIAVQTLAVVVNVALSLLLIPRFGTAGAALAGLVSYSLGGLLIIAAFARSSGLAMKVLFLPTRQDFRLYAERANSAVAVLRATTGFR